MYSFYVTELEPSATKIVAVIVGLLVLCVLAFFAGMWIVAQIPSEPEVEYHSEVERAKVLVQVVDSIAIEIGYLAIMTNAVELRIQQDIAMFNAMMPLPDSDMRLRNYGMGGGDDD